MIADTRHSQILCIYLASCIVLGGASAAGVLANLVLQLCAIPLLILSLVRLSGKTLGRRHVALLAIAGAAALLPLMQLVPMAPSAWQGLPFRDGIAGGFAALGMALPWLPVSLDPSATLASWLALLPAAALVLAVMTLEADQRVWIGWTVLGAALVSALIGMAQFGSGDLYFYDITSGGSAVGFFANRNHLATLLLVALPALTLHLSVAGTPVTGMPGRGMPGWSSRDIVFLGLLAILLLGILFTGSRAGIGLALPVLLTSLGLRMRAHSGQSPRLLIIAAGSVSALIVAAIAFGPSLARAFRKTALLNEDDTRLVAMQTTAEAGWRAFPVGTGFGTFDPIFRLVGGDANLGTNFVNHAHNDYVELWLTGGLAAAALIFGFLWWFVGAARASWRARSDNAGAVPRVAAVSIAIILVHSLVDYPLRTAAMSAIFAVCCGLLLEPVLARRRLDRGARPYGGANPAMPAREALALRARQEALAPAVLSPALGTAVPPSHFADAPASVESCAGTGR